MMLSRGVCCRLSMRRPRVSLESSSGPTGPWPAPSRSYPAPSYRTVAPASSAPSLPYVYVSPSLSVSPSLPYVYVSPSMSVSLTEYITLNCPKCMYHPHIVYHPHCPLCMFHPHCSFVCVTLSTVCVSPPLGVIYRQ